MLTVACVYRTGGTYRREWVWALKRGLNRHLLDFRFACLTDDPAVESYWRVPLIQQWGGWWSKLELFRPGLFEGPVLYLDLDTLPVGDLSEIASYRGRFAMLNDFYRGEDQVASGVMAWTPGPHTEAIFKAFQEESRHGIPVGRSDFWYAQNAPNPERLQDLFPNQIVSYKVHAKSGPPAGSRLVCGHGTPRFNDPKAGWAHNAWKSLATKPEMVDSSE